MLFKAKRHFNNYVFKLTFKTNICFFNINCDSRRKCQLLGNFISVSDSSLDNMQTLIWQLQSADEGIEELSILLKILNNILLELLCLFI